MNIKEINEGLVKKLIAQQFPEFGNLAIQSVKMQGHDNRTFRLGSNMLVRMPTAKAYALKVPKEHEWLPRLASHSTMPIPVPLKMGKPSEDYPFNFSIYKWLDGKSANSITMDDKGLEDIARGLALFLKELQRIDASGAPEPGLHNWWRGDQVSVYNHQARTQIADLSGIIDSDKAIVLWEKALKSKWTQKPVWIHGDVASGNILIKNGNLSGVIDFGGMAVGDPACDLVIAWTFFKNHSRSIFKEHIGLDADTWDRARGWALWKASFELVKLKEKNSPDAMIQQKIINDLLTDL